MMYQNVRYLFKVTKLSLDSRQECGIVLICLILDLFDICVLYTSHNKFSNDGFNETTHRDCRVSLNLAATDFHLV